MVARVESNNLTRLTDRVFLAEEIADNPNKLKKIDAVAVSLVNERIFNPIDTVDRNGIDARLNNLILKVGGGADSVGGLLRRSSGNIVAEQEKAEEALDVIGKAVYMVMRFGGDSRLTDALLTANDVEAVLPDRLKGIGAKVVECDFHDEGILALLGQIDSTERKMSRAGASGLKTVKAKIDFVLGELSNYPEGYDDAELALAIVSVKAVEIDGKMGVGTFMTPETSETDEQAYYAALRKYEEEKGKLQEEITQVSLVEWVDAQVSVSAPRERAPQLWEYKPPEWMNGTSRKDWRMLLTLADGMVGGTYQKKHDKNGYNTSLESVKKYSMSMMELPEEDFKFIQEHPVLKGGEVAHEIFQELMVPVVTRATIDGQEKTSTTFVFPYEISADGKKFYTGKVKDLVDNQVAYKKGLAERLVEKGIVKNIEAAKLSVALTMDAFEVGGVFSAADVLRKLSWESDAVRLAQRPNTKFDAKIDEMWGGPWGAYCKAIARGDSKKALQVAENLGIVPKLLAGSFLDVQKQDGKSWAQKMYDGEKIKMGEVSNDLYFGWRKDSLNAACDVLMYITKEKPLQFKSFAEPDNVISDWIASLYNDIKALRENGTSLLTVEAICGAFGGSVGIWPFEGPYFRISALDDPKKHLNYFSVGSEVVRQLGLSSEDENNFLEFFGVDRGYFVDLNDKMTDYSTILNPNATTKDKAERYTKGTLLKKRVKR